MSGLVDGVLRYASQRILSNHQSVPGAFDADLLLERKHVLHFAGNCDEIKCQSINYKETKKRFVQIAFRLFLEVVEVRTIVEFESPPSWLPNASKNGREYIDTQTRG